MDSLHYALLIPTSVLLNSDPHGLTEMLYSFQGTCKQYFPNTPETALTLMPKDFY